jgi:hypothetical protein
MSKWMQASNNSNASNKSNTFSQNLSKIERLKILESLNLPLADYLYLTPEEINRENKIFTDFVNKCTTILIIAIPFDQSLPRKYQVMPSEISEIENFLKIVLSGGKYSVLIKNHSIKPVYSGVIISNENKLIIELSPESLDKMLDGKVIPSTYLLEHTSGSETLTKENAEIREILNIVKTLISSEGNGFLKGYFEFVVEPQKQIKFWEYKNDLKYTRL